MVVGRSQIFQKRLLSQVHYQSQCYVTNGREYAFFGTECEMVPAAPNWGE